MVLQMCSPSHAAPAVTAPPAASVVTAVPAAAALPTPAELEAVDAVIGRIIITAGDVFDTSVPGERAWLYRAANRLHINTRPAVLRQQLLFKTGEPYRERIIAESERLLRSNDFLYDAEIVPVAWDGHTVDLEVRTRDNWTLNPGLNFSRKGGQNKASVQLEEKNLLGTGQQIKLDWGKDYDRESLTFRFLAPNLFTPWGRFGVTYADADDGETKALFYERPFYALDTRRAAGIDLFDNQRNDSRYVRGHQVGEFQHREEHYEAYGGWSTGLRDGWVTRYTVGATLQRDRFALEPGVQSGGPLPADREFIYPWFGVELVADRYQERVNQDQIKRTEDVLVGLRASARIGYASRSFGSDRDAWLLQAAAQDGHDFGTRGSLFGSANASGRLEDGTLRDGILSAEARYYWRTSPKTKLFVAGNGTVTHNLDEDTQLMIGGDNGLRGYPLRYQAGTAAAVFTVEGRYYTNWYPFRLFHVAGAAFYDMGRTWGRDVTGARSDGLLKDVGVGLRLGSSRSAFGNVLHVDLAFPLDGDPTIKDVQFVIETRNRF